MRLSTSSPAGNPHASKKLQSAAHWIPLFPCNESYLPVYLDNIRKPVLVIALGLVATGCAHLANVTTTQPGVPRLMVEEEQLQSATEHLARAKHEQPSLSLGDDLSAAKLSLNVLERRPGDLSAQRIYNFSVARVVENIERADLQPWREPSNIACGQERFRLAAPRPVDAEHDPSRYDLLPIDTLKASGQFFKTRLSVCGIGAPLIAVGKCDRRVSFPMSENSCGLRSIT
jgi:hypothetical protein